MAEHVGATAAPSEEVNGGHTATEETKDETSKSTETTAPTTDTTEPNAQTNEKDAEAEATTTSQSPSADGKKRKQPSTDDRDWRTRRDEDNAKETARPQRHSKRLFKPYSSNIKSDYSNQPESSDPDEIRKQVEFYFSDSNLPTDKFLLTQTGGSANKPVPLSTLHSFKRMRRFQPYTAVLAALRESTFLTVNDKEEVARREPLPENMVADVNANVKLVEDVTRPRSVYAKGFGEEGPTTQFDIEAFFAPYGPTNAIRLRRRYPDKLFKGSVFVEFDSEETAKRFLALDPKPKFDGRDLLIMSKEEYVVKKAKEVADGKISGNAWRERSSGGRGGSGHRGGPGGRRGRGGRGGGRGGYREERRGKRDFHGRRREGREKRGREDDGDEDEQPETSEAKKVKLDDNAADGQQPKGEEEAATTGPPADKDPEVGAGMAGSV